MIFMGELRFGEMDKRIAWSALIVGKGMAYLDLTRYFYKQLIGKANGRELGSDHAPYVNVRKTNMGTRTEYNIKVELTCHKLPSRIDIARSEKCLENAVRQTEIRCKKWYDKYLSSSDIDLDF